MEGGGGGYEKTMDLFFVTIGMLRDDRRRVGRNVGGGRFYFSV